MSIRKQLEAINRVLAEYFNSNREELIVPAKNLMPAFIDAGIFEKDHKNGLPIRNVLRDLDRTGQLHLIPYVHAERKVKNTNWFFVNRSVERKLDSNPVRPPITTVPSTKRARSKPAKTRDEAYVLDLCDEVLNEKSLRQHRFPFLLGDAGTRLPVDAYYPTTNLVIEYRERQHTEPISHFDKPDRMTRSGVNRREQRRIYDERRSTELPKNGIKLVEISYTDFPCNRKGRILRNPEADRTTIANLLRSQSIL